MNRTIKEIWIVDDERIVRVSLADELRDAGYIVKEFAEGTSLLGALREYTPDVIIADFKMPMLDGMELLNKVMDIHADIYFILMTAYGTIKDAVKAMQNGAYHYILKPFDTEEILLILERLNKINEIKNENIQLKKQVEQKFDFSSYIGEVETNKELFNLLKKVATKDSTVLITGETGTGKEMIASILHYNSLRKKEAFVKVSCAILSKDIFESELFGHVKGAFTGADADKTGRFELANNGTLFLDDIDDVPLELQVKLLRAIEQREIEKVGSSKTIPINVRLIASTKKDLRILVEEGKFREDLFYRINIFPIELLPLRNRKKDIRVLLYHFLNQFTENTNVLISEEAQSILYNYHWPGNIRELKNIAERLSILTSDKIIKPHHIPSEIRDIRSHDICSMVGKKPLEKLLSDIEISSIKCALERTENNKSKAAEILGIPVSTLQSKMHKYKI